MARALPALIALLVLAPAASPHPAARCGRPTDFRVGPIRLGFYHDPLTGKLEFKLGYPTKVVIFARRRVPAAVTLRGRRCSDGRPLRFWYGRDAQPFPALPVSEEALAARGDLVLRVPRMPRGANTGGYMLFSSAGDWKLTVRQRSRVLGTVIVRLPTPT
jgi:hypothetical protein